MEIYMITGLVTILIIVVGVFMAVDVHNSKVDAEKERELSDALDNMNDANENTKYWKASTEEYKALAEQRAIKSAHWQALADTRVQQLLQATEKIKKQEVKLKKAGDVVNGLLKKNRLLDLSNKLVKLSTMLRASLCDNLDKKIEELSHANAELKAEISKAKSFASTGAKTVRKNRKVYPRKKLTPDQVQEIIKLHGAYSQQALAKLYKVSRQMIAKIVNKKYA